MISGLDPAAVSYWIGSNRYIHSGDADYVQIIHTSYLGTQMERGDSDIYISTDRWHSQKNHILAIGLHEITSAKKYLLIASQNGNGRMINLETNPQLKSHIELADDECLVGVYSNGHPKQENEENGKTGKTFKLSLSFKAA